MKSTPLRTQFMNMQFSTVSMRAMLAHAQIVSGSYKFLQTEVGCGSNPDGTIQFRPLTDDEKLQEVVGRMQRQIAFMQEHVDSVGEKLSEEDDQAQRLLHDVSYGETQD